MRTAVISDDRRPLAVARTTADAKLAIDQGTRGSVYLTPTEVSRLQAFIRGTDVRTVSPARARLVRWDTDTNTVEVVS